MKKNILVTGANGFIGRTVVAKLLQHGYFVTAMVRPGSIPALTPHSRLSLLRADITNYDSFSDKTKLIDGIVHLAANKYHPKLSYQTNLAGAKNLSRLIKEKRMRGARLINISSQSTKIRFKGVYGKSKQQSDHIIESSEAAWTTLKPSLVYGAGAETLFQTIRTYVEKLPFVPVIGNGKWELSPIAVEDVAGAIIACIEKPATIGKVYDLGSPQPVQFDELVRRIQKELGITKPIVHIPALIGVVGVFMATKIIPSLPITVDNVLGSTQNTHCNPKPALKDLGLKLLPLEEGIKKYLFPSSNSKGVKVAMVGLGKMGIMHATLLHHMPNVRIAAIIDRDKSLGQTAQSMGIAAPFYSSLEEALEHESIEAVFICTPTFAHEEVMAVCEKHRLPYFVEKPLFPEFKTYAKLKLSDSNMTGYFWVYKREVVYAKKLLEQGAIGTPQRYSIHLLHSEVFGPKKGWLFQKKLSGGGALMNPGPHAISIATHLFGKGSVKNAKLIYKYKNEVEDIAQLKIQHGSKISGSIDISWSAPNHPIMAINFEIIGSQGKIVFKDQQFALTQGKKTTRLPYYAIPYETAVFNLNPQSSGEAYYAEDQAFISSFKTQAKYANTVTFARDVERVIGEAYAKA